MEFESEWVGSPTGVLIMYKTILFSILSGNENHGINFGAEVVEGKIGSALNFNGVGNYASLVADGEAPPQIISSLGKGSISIWFKVDHIPTDYGIAPMFYYGAEEMCNFFDAANQGMIIELGHSPIFPGSEELFFTMWKNGCTYPSFCFDSNLPIPEGEWVHFVAVVGEDYNTGYLNGNEMTNRVYNFGTPNDSQFFEDAVVHEKMWLGRGYWDETVQYYDGMIDDIRIYDRPLTSQEVEELHSDTAVITSVSSLEGDASSINIHPNPANRYFNYDLSALKDARVKTIEFIDVSGKTVMHQNLSEKSGSVPVAYLPPGFYMMNFHFNEGVLRKKLLIDR
ncbi:MAG: LamG-like jellyroll fold domain-containing protein [Bacteroidales bacterium]|nr:LamG-like jellyroll fold domain-containing protein [Bacteroidales bacterium]